MLARDTAGVTSELTLRTLGHACLALYREGENPLLVTDPWLVGSVYWRSWWLQNYPSQEEIAWLAKAWNSSSVIFERDVPMMRVGSEN